MNIWAPLSLRELWYVWYVCAWKRTSRENQAKKQCATTDYNLRHTSILGYTDELRWRVRLHSFIRSDINSWTCFDLQVILREMPEEVTPFLISTFWNLLICSWYSRNVKSKTCADKIWNYPHALPFNRLDQFCALRGSCRDYTLVGSWFMLSVTQPDQCFSTLGLKG